MWHDHPFNQRNMTSERAAGLGVGGDPEMGVGNIGGSSYNNSANYVKRL